MVDINVNTNVRVALLANQLSTHAMYGERGKKFSMWTLRGDSKKMLFNQNFALPNEVEHVDEKVIKVVSVVSEANLVEKPWGVDIGTTYHVCSDKRSFI